MLYTSANPLYYHYHYHYIKDYIVKLLRIFFIVYFTFTISSCNRTILVKNYPFNEISALTHDHSLTDIKKAIIRGVMSKGWTVKEESEGKLLATLNLRKHLLVVSISYDKNNYAIAYVDSSKLLYDGKHIHRKYANWIKNIQKAINSNMLDLFNSR